MSKELTNDDKARLATELCGLVGPIFSTSDEGFCGNERRWTQPCLWYYKGDEKYVPVSFFDPVNNGQHMLLVLKGTAKHEQQRLSKIHGPQSWNNMGWDRVFDGLKSRVFHKWNKPFHVGSAVCTAGLVVLNQKGDKP